MSEKNLSALVLSCFCWLCHFVWDRPLESGAPLFVLGDFRDYSVGVVGVKFSGSYDPVSVAGSRVGGDCIYCDRTTRGAF